MGLAEFCVRELYEYFNRPVSVEKETIKATPVSQASEFDRAVSSYSAFRRNTAQLLESTGSIPDLSFFYVVLPAIFQNAVASNDTWLKSPSKEYEQMVDEFLSGYKIAYQPFNLHDIAFKTLEKIHFNQVPHETPSLELGLGNGYVSNFIFKDTKLTVGSDPTLFTLEASRYKRHEHYISIDASNIPFENESFRTIYMVHAIDHVPNRLDILKEMERVLMPGGKIVFTDVSQFSRELMPLSDIYQTMGFDRLSSDAYSFYLDYAGDSREVYSTETYYQTLENLGFEEISLQYFVSPRLAKLCWVWFELHLVTGRFGEYLDALRSPGNRKIRKFYFDFVQRTLTPLIALDKELCTQEGKGFNVFITAKKRGGDGHKGQTVAPAQSEILKKLICPQCKSKIGPQEDSYLCSNCNLDYPILESVPLLIPFYAEGYAKIKNMPANQLATLMGKIKRKIRSKPYLTSAIRRTIKTIRRLGLTR